MPLTINDILTRSEALIAEVQENSITPPRVGELIYALAELIQQGAAGGTTIGIRKLSELEDVELAGLKNLNILQLLGEKWRNVEFDIVKLNNLAGYFNLDDDDNLFTTYNLYSTKGISAYGAGTGVDGGATGYDRLDAWSAYTVEKSGWVLSAFLGNNLNDRVSELEAGGTGSGSDVVWGTPAGGHVSLTVDSVMNILALATHEHTISQISDFPASMPASDVYSWAKAPTKPSYIASEIGGLGASYRWLTDTYIATWNAKEPAITKGTTAQYFRGDMSLALFPTSLPASDVSSWAKASTKPSYTASEIGGLGASYQWLTDAYIATWNAKANGTHGHYKSDIVDFAHSHVKTDITDFAHTHTISDITSLQDVLNSKLATSIFTAHAANQTTNVKHLTDAQLSSLTALASYWKLDNDGNLYTEKNVYSTGEVSAYGLGSTGGGGGVGSLVTWGTESAGSVPLTVEGVTKTLSLASHTHSGYLTVESDPTVPAWAKAPAKPSYIASEIGGLGASYRWLTDTYIATWNAKEPAITKGTTAQYFRGDMSLALFPTSLPASDVSSWAKASTKPSYTASEIGGLGASYRWLTDAYITTWNAKEPAIVKLTAFNKNFGTTAGTVSEGNHTHTFESLTSKPTTLSGYGITDALLASAYTAADVLTKLKTVDGHSSGLDADTVDGKHVTTSGWWDKLAYIGASDGVMEVGAHIDFHELSTGGADYAGRLSCYGGSPLWSGNAMYYALNANRTDVNWAAATLTAQTDILTPFNTWSNATDKNSLKKFLGLFDIDASGNLVVKTNLYSTGEVTAYSSGTGVSGLKLMGDLNVNNYDIYSAKAIQAGEVVLSNIGGKMGLHEELIGTTIAAFDENDYNYYFADNKLIYDNTNNIFSVTGQVNATEFKFGNYSFKQSANGLSICYNGVEQAYITNTGQYVNS